MPSAVSNATRIWEVNIHWDLYSQCGIWDQKGKGVDIWECIRARQSQRIICPFLSNPHRFAFHCRSFYRYHSATKPYLLEIRDSTVDLGPPARSQGATHRTPHPGSRVRCSFLVMRKIPPPASFPGVMHPIHSGYSQSACVVSVRRLSASIETMECDSDDRTGRQDLGSLSGISLSTLSSFPSVFFHFGSGSVVHLLPLSHLPFPYRRLNHFFYNRCLLLSCATFSIYHPLSRSVYICRSIARIRLFIITVQACYYLYTSLILSSAAELFHLTGTRWCRHRYISDIAFVLAVFPISQLVPDRSSPAKSQNTWRKDSSAWIRPATSPEHEGLAGTSKPLGGIVHPDALRSVSHFKIPIWTVLAPGLRIPAACSCAQREPRLRSEATGVLSPLHLPPACDTVFDLI